MSRAFLTGCRLIIPKLFSPFLATLSLSQMESSSRPELLEFKGVSMSSLFTSNWENIQNFQARHDDILIATYPKAGRLLANCALARPPNTVSARGTFRVGGWQTNTQLAGVMGGPTSAMLEFALMPNGEQCAPLFILCVFVNAVPQERHGSPTSLISCTLA